jgi:hypothetical protein
VSKPFRHSAGFGKRIEFTVLARMLKEGLDVYVPLVDDMGVDAVVRRGSGFIEVQVKARSEDAKPGTEGLFTVQKHELRDNYWFVFFSEKMGKTWVMTSEEFIQHSQVTKTGKYEGLRYLNFMTKKRQAVLRQYEANDFSRLQCPEKP